MDSVCKVNSEEDMFKKKQDLQEILSCFSFFKYRLFAHFNRNYDVVNLQFKRESNLP